MKIALLLGISKYNKPLNDLLACEGETKLMGKLLEATKQYNDILVVTTDTTGAKIKSRITAWIESHRNAEIDEVFFYYTGHGDFKDGEFYFPLSDFDGEKRKQTSLTNSEVDSWLRSLRPKLAVKVVDACHAGIPYVKDDTDTFAKYLEKSGASYQKCYFMFSSEIDQSSYQDKNFSHFTRYFVESIRQHQAELIRYRDIMDFISDNFSRNFLQTPFFVIQANNTEAFSKITPELLKLCSENEEMTITPSEQDKVEVSQSLSLLQLIQKDAEEYCDETEVTEILLELQSKVQAFTYEDEFEKLYDVEYSFSQNIVYIPENSVIGEWLKKNEGSFFAEPTYKTEEYQVEVESRTYSEKMWGPYITKKRQRQVVDGYRLTDYSQPFSVVQIKAEPKFPNINSCSCIIAFIHSMVSIRFFYYYAEFKATSWSSRGLITPIRWQTIGTKFKDGDAIWKNVENIQRGFSAWIISRIKDNLGLQETDDAI